MPVKFFWVSIQDDGTGEAALNAFLGSHRVLEVDRRWVDRGAAARVEHATAPLSVRANRVDSPARLLFALMSRRVVMRPCHTSIRSV